MCHRWQFGDPVPASARCSIARATRAILAWYARISIRKSSRSGRRRVDWLLTGCFLLSVLQILWIVCLIACRVIAVLCECAQLSVLFCAMRFASGLFLRLQFLL
jgi:uncharacterized membrane protein